MSLRARVARFLNTDTVTHHGPDAPRRPARTRTRTALALAAALGTGACATSGLDPVDAPSRSFALPEIAAAAAAHGGHAVSYVHPDRASHYLEDVHTNRVAPDGRPAEGEVKQFHKNQLLLARLAGSPPQVVYSSDATYDRSCTAVIADDPGRDYLLAANADAFETPGTSARFTTLHELGGHCAYLPDKAAQKHGVTHIRHLMESQADAVGAALLAAEHGHTRDARKIADMRAVNVMAGLHLKPKDAAGQTVEGGGFNTAAYMTLPALDAALDWADSRLALSPGDPNHLSNMPPRQIIREATQVALDNTLEPAQIARLGRHLSPHAPAERAYDPQADFKAIPAPRDPAIQPAFQRLHQAHERLYGPEAVSAQAPVTPRRTARAGPELGD